MENSSNFIKRLSLSLFWTGLLFVLTNRPSSRPRPIPHLAGNKNWKEAKNGRIYYKAASKLPDILTHIKNHNWENFIMKGNKQCLNRLSQVTAFFVCASSSSFELFFN